MRLRIAASALTTGGWDGRFWNSSGADPRRDMKPSKLQNDSKTAASLFLVFCQVILLFPLVSRYKFGGKFRGKHETRGCVATTTVQPLPYDCFHGVTWKETVYTKRSVDVQPTAECAMLLNGQSGSELHVYDSASKHSPSHFVFHTCQGK